MKINKIVVAIISMIVVSGIVFWINKDTNLVQSDELTTVKLSVLQNGDYTPKSIKVKLGTKVRIEADANTLVGPMGKLIIDGYDLSKEISPSSNVLEFVADKSGKFRIHCENNMGNGTLIVYER